MTDTAKTSLTARAAAWYTAAYRRLDSYLDGGPASHPALVDPYGAAYDVRAAIAARYARRASEAAAISRNIRESKPAGYTR